MKINSKYRVRIEAIERSEESSGYSKLTTAELYSQEFLELNLDAVVIFLNTHQREILDKGNTQP